MNYPGQGEFSFDEDASFLLPGAEVFRQNPNMMNEIWFFSQKKLPKRFDGTRWMQFWHPCRTFRRMCIIYQEFFTAQKILFRS